MTQSPQSQIALRKPEWLKVRLPGGENYTRLKTGLRGLGLHTVCEEAQCPNVGECWSEGTATIMILGDTCTRGCHFCAVKTGNPKGVVDWGEPERVAKQVAESGLQYLVMTMVNRDDLADGGAWIVAQTVQQIKKRAPAMLIEVLVSDFQGRREDVATVVASGAEVFAHNVETVERLTPKVRDTRANYRQSLRVLEMAKEIDPKCFTKSSLMIGVGESDEEIRQSMRDLRAARVDFLTLGQYLRPTAWHLPVAGYVEPSRFEAYRVYGEELGFRYVASGPLVRSSYRAGEFFIAQAIRTASS